jgi:hypothetical protein
MELGGNLFGVGHAGDSITRTLSDYAAMDQCSTSSQTVRLHQQPSHHLFFLDRKHFFYALAEGEVEIDPSQGE